MDDAWLSPSNGWLIFLENQILEQTDAEPVSIALTPGVRKLSYDDQSLLAVVTGASAGLGRALSHQLTSRGIRVVGLARNESELNVTSRKCFSGTFFPIRCNIADSMDVQKAAAVIQGNIGAVHILINNAAILDRYDFVSSDADHINEQILTNLLGPVNCVRAFLPQMLLQKKGRILNVGSFAGDDPQKGSLGYAVSKAGARCFSTALARELESTLPSVIVTEWIPGIMCTRHGEPGGIDPDMAARWGVTLALDDRVELHGKTYLKDKEFIMPMSMRQKFRRVAASFF